MKNYRSRATPRFLFNLSPDPAAIVDGKGNFLTVNDAFQERTGLSRKALVGTHILKLNIVTPESKAVLSENLKNRMQGAPVESYEVCFIGRTGKKRWVEVSGKKVSYAGQPASFVVFHDVTDRKKKADEQIRFSEEKYKNLFENAPDVIVTIDLTGKITSVNKAIMQHGFRENEIVGNSIFKLVPIEYNQKMLTGLKNIAAGNSAQGEIEILTPNGKRSAEYNINPIRLNGKVVGCQTIMRDITERKKAEEALRESEEKHRKLFEESMDAILVADAAAGMIVDCNPAASKLVGWQKSELVGQHQSIIFPQEQIDGGFSRSFKRHLKDPTKTLETQVMRKTGEIRDVAVKATVFDLKGKKLMQGAFRDITERKKAEEALKESEEKYQATFESSMDALMLLDEKTFFDCNQSTLRLFGCKSVEEFIKNHPADLSPPTQPDDTPSMDAAMSHIQKAFQTGTDEFFWIHKRTDGTTFPADVLLTRMPLKDREVLQATVRDITERKKAEEALKESEEKFRNLADQSPNIIFINQKGKVVYANTEAEEVTGYTKDEFYSPKFNYMDLIAPESKELVKSLFIKHVKGEGVRPYEFKLISKKGQIIDVINSTKVIDYNGEPAILGIETDITESKRLKEKLEQYSMHLEDLVKERTVQLEQAQAQLVKSERLAAIGELAGMVGHDLRNPLTGIKNAAYYLKKKGAECPESQFKEMFEIIDKAIDHSNKIINDLLDYAREMHLELTESSLPTLLSEAVRMIQVPDRIQILNHVYEETKVKVDADKMIRVFINLIKNAVDAMPQKGTLEITSHKTRGNVEIAFADTGTGIPKETLPKLFSPLFTTKAQGMGFGLAICKRIIEAHGGTITVKTAVNKGTTFTITLPVKPKLEIGGEKTWINMPESLLSTTTKA